MEKKKTMLSTGVALLLLVGIGLTYAWFNLRINIKSNKDISVKLGTLSLNYVDGSAISVENMEPGWTTNKTITVENTGTKDASYKLIWKELTNEFINDELVVSIECESNTDSCAYVNEEESIIASEAGDLSNDVIISPQEIQTIKLTFTFKEMNKNQNYNQGKRFRGIVNIAESTNSGPVLAIFRILDKDGNEVTDKGILTDSNEILNVQGGYFTELIQYGENTLRLVDTDLNTLDSRTINLSNKKESDIVGNNFYKDIELDTITATVVLDENNKISSITNLIVPPESCFTASNNTLQSYTCSDSIKELILPTEINGEEINDVYVFSEMAFITSMFDAQELHKIEIPKTFTQISYGAFKNSGISHIKIPNSVTSIGSHAFANNNLTSVTIPDSVKDIGYSSFSSNKLVDIKIPNSVTIIDGYTFGNNNLTSVTIPNNVASIEDGAFEDNNLTSVIIPNSVTSIGSSAFENNNLTSVTIPNSVTSIGMKAFINNNLTSVTIPDSVTSIGSSAFANNSLTDVTIPSSVTYIGTSAFNNNQLPDDKAFIYQRNSNGTEDKETIVSYGGKNKNPIIPNNVKTIGNSSFIDNKLTNITIPESVTSIGYSAFANNNLTSVIIPDSVTTIRSSTFSNNNLTSVTIPNSVTLIDSNAFKENKLRSIVIPNSVTSIGQSAFENNNLISVIIPEGITEIRNYAFFKNNLTNVTIPSSVTSIGYYAFSNNNLTSVTIPNSVTIIYNGAFSNNNFKSVTIKGKASSSEFTTYSPNWGWSSSATCVKDNTSNVTNGCITWGA